MTLTSNKITILIGLIAIIGTASLAFANQSVASTLAVDIDSTRTSPAPSSIKASEIITTSVPTPKTETPRTQIKVTPKPTPVQAPTALAVIPKVTSSSQPVPPDVRPHPITITNPIPTIVPATTTTPIPAEPSSIPKPLADTSPVLKPLAEPSPDPTPLPETVVDGQLVGIALTGPTCPVVSNDNFFECQDRPYIGKISVYDYSGNKVTSFSPDENGRFSIDIKPGKYILRTDDISTCTTGICPAPSMLPHGELTNVSIEAGQQTQVTFLLDSGIR